MFEKTLKKLFGGLELSWPRLIVAALAAAVFTAAMAIIPALHYTSFIAITVTFEVWILFGILIIMNSRSNLDSALKCFVFFLISQPLIYLLQVPFSPLGWQLFSYYRYWFIWTVLCLPMGFIGYYMKKNKWWGLLILLPMLVLTAYCFSGYLSKLLFAFPRYLLIVLFCVAALLVYPVAIFSGKKLRATGLAISAALLVAVCVLCFLDPPVYSTDVLGDSEEHPFDESYSVSLGDSRYGDVSIQYVPEIEAYMVHADFKKAGTTTLTLVSPDGEETVFDLHIEEDTYRLTKK